MSEKRSKNDIQLFLFPSEEENKLWLECPRFRELTIDQQSFVAAYFTLVAETGDVPSIREVGKRVGWGKSKAYDVHDSEGVLEALAEGAQVHSSLADVMGSVAYDALIVDTLQKVYSGKITGENVTAQTLRLLSDAKARLGLAPVTVKGMVADNGHGARIAGVSASGSEAADVVGALMAEMRNVEKGAAAAGVIESEVSEEDEVPDE